MAGASHTSCAVTPSRENHASTRSGEAKTALTPEATRDLMRRVARDT